MVLWLSRDITHGRVMSRHISEAVKTLQ